MYNSKYTGKQVEDLLDAASADFIVSAYASFSNNTIELNFHNFEDDDSNSVSVLKIGDGLTLSSDGTISCSFTPTKYYTGSTEPASTLGNDGDLYLQTS